MTLSKGRPIRGAAGWEPILAGPVERQGLVIQGGVMQSSPVKSGALRRAWTTTKPSWEGKRYLVRIGNNTVYARYHNTRTRNKGYVKTGIDAAKDQAKSELMNGIRSQARKLWQK